MYYPKQLPYLLDKEFKENITYQEFYFEELKDFIMCIWTMKSKKILEKTIYNYILPDACIDIVIDFTNQTICFAGFSKETIPFLLNQKIDFLGVRLKPSVFYTLFQVNASQVMDHQIDFSTLELDPYLKTILKVEAKERIQIVKSYLINKVKGIKELPYVEIVNQLYQNPKDQTVFDIAHNLGYNQRHLIRIFKKQYGISPKVLLNILRLHLCLTLLLEEKDTLNEIMEICGFYDQSHFIKEIKRYTGFSPLELLNQY